MLLRDLARWAGVVGLLMKCGLFGGITIISDSRMTEWASFCVGSFGGEVDGCILGGRELDVRQWTLGQGCGHWLAEEGIVREEGWIGSGG